MNENENFRKLIYFIANGFLPINTSLDAEWIKTGEPDLLPRPVSYKINEMNKYEEEKK